MTLSNRITLAGALPLLVAIAVSALIAAIVLAPSTPASAATSTKTCGLDPVLLDVLLDRYGKKAQECDTLNPAAGQDTALDNDDFDPAVWQFDGRELTEFAISKADSDVLIEIHETTSGFPAAVKYIDLTGNPLTIEDVDFANIPATVAVILSADSNVNGFQASEYTVTEGSPSYVAVAFPGAKVASDANPAGTLQPAFTISGRDAVANFGTNAFLSGSHLQRIDFGDQETQDVAARTAQVNSVADNRIFYLPLQANRDNDNRDEWDFTITITEPVPGADTTVAFELANDEADITVLDADAPALSVCDRSEDVEAAILALTESPSPANLYGGHTKCDDLTLRDLGEIPGLSVLDADGDNEPIVDLIAGDFEGLAKAATLSITGAGALPSGIFAGVGKDATGGVEITLAKNNSADEDVAEVGKYTPSTIPQHIFDDQEVNQIIILDDDLNDEKKGVTSGLDAASYSVMEGSQFFVLTPALQTYYVLNKTAVLGSLASTPDIDTARRGNTTDSPKVARYAVPATKDALDDDNANDESMVLFLFNAATPADTGSLVDIALVTVIDDD